MSVLNVWCARFSDIVVHRTWDKTAPAFNTNGQETHTSDQLLEP